MGYNAELFTVKLSFNGEMRRFPFDGTSFTTLYEQIISLLGLEKTAELLIKYTDEQGDLITMSSDLELKSALVKGQLLRITATYKRDEVLIPVTSDTVPSCANGLGCRSPGEFSDEKAREFCKKMRLGPVEFGLPRTRGPCGRPHGLFGRHHNHHHRGAFVHPHDPCGRSHGRHGGGRHCGGKNKEEKLEARFAKGVSLEDGKEINAASVPFTTGSFAPLTMDSVAPLIDAVLSNEQFRDVKRRKVFRLLWKFDGDKEKVVAVLTKKLACKAERREHKQMKRGLKH